jgi:hypothetical protein
MTYQNDNQNDADSRRLKNLQKAYDRTNTFCDYGDYQSRMNSLTNSIAEFLLKIKTEDEECQ